MKEGTYVCNAMHVHASSLLDEALSELLRGHMKPPGHLRYEPGKPEISKNCN